MWWSSERARRAILKYKDHPAVLLWGIGNEMEGPGRADNAAIWSAINNIAAMAQLGYDLTTHASKRGSSASPVP